ncbi:dTMP kinase [Candidatus Woesearchaeota archaeon]|nr:dTMP kinase [Candidatus Woesearchaeota archaeon]
MEYKNNFISFEGIDGSGKSTIVSLLVERMEEKGVKIYKTRDPIRDKNPWYELYDLFEHSQRVDKFSEALLLLSSRVDNVNRFIKPELNKGSIIIADRFSDSWFAYQSLRLEKFFGSSKKSLDYLIDLHNSLIEEGVLINPDKTFLFKINPEIAFERIKRKSKISKYEKLNFLKKVLEQYEIISDRFNERIDLIDTEGKSIEEVYETVFSKIN